MESISLSFRVVSLFRAILTAVTAFLVVLAVLFCKIFIIVLLAAYLFLYFFYLPRIIKSYKITHDNDSLRVLRGVFIKRESVFSNRQLIYVRTITTPLYRLFGCKIIVLSAPRVRFMLVADDISTEKILGDGYDKN